MCDEPDAQPEPRWSFLSRAFYVGTPQKVINFFFKIKLLKIYSWNPNFNIFYGILSKNRFLIFLKKNKNSFSAFFWKKWHICLFLEQIFGFLWNHLPGEKNDHLCSGRHYENSVTQIYMCDEPDAQPEPRWSFLSRAFYVGTPQKVINFFFKIKLLKIYSWNPNFNIFYGILSKNRFLIFLKKK